ncbi:MaoC family dehydratase [Microbacterium schleiferi]|uniref:MaoC family dehydratase n=1 Tax=Microbacterium schleiferi TaxID=69362 RepID=A0A7S8MZS8_9MICO|nr:MaoC family dehydratase [Microbacterium schleiferi]QPE05590.1 MaoC family dehydratase [Microbacterium schleiferi]
MELTLAQVREAVDLDLGVTDWFTVEQSLITKFSEITTDDQWIHVDEERAAKGPFGTTIAHGYLISALIAQFMEELLVITDRELTVNYGIDALRFTGPVPTGSRIRCRMRIADSKMKNDAIVCALDVRIEREGVEKPVLVGKVLFRFS